jgi:hypothetical protein
LALPQSWRSPRVSTALRPGLSQSRHCPKARTLPESALACSQDSPRGRVGAALESALPYGRRSPRVGTALPQSRRWPKARTPQESAPRRSLFPYGLQPPRLSEYVRYAPLLSVASLLLPAESVPLQALSFSRVSQSRPHSGVCSPMGSSLLVSQSMSATLPYSVWSPYSSQRSLFPYGLHPPPGSESPTGPPPLFSPIGFSGVSVSSLSLS